MAFNFYEHERPFPLEEFIARYDRPIFEEEEFLRTDKEIRFLHIEDRQTGQAEIFCWGSSLGFSHSQMRAQIGNVGGTKIVDAGFVEVSEAGSGKSELLFKGESKTLTLQGLLSEEFSVRREKTAEAARRILSQRTDRRRSIRIASPVR